MTHMPANIEEIINKGMKEIEERVVAEQQKKNLWKGNRLEVKRINLVRQRPQTQEQNRSRG